MRAEDIARLSTPYQQPLAEDRDRLFRKTLGVDVPPLQELCQEIIADLDPVRRGIGWWSPGLDKFRRIFIGDQLVLCAGSIADNLQEAKLHLLEVKDALDRDKQVAELVRTGALPPPTSAADDLPAHLFSLHLGGFFRALGSALDCLGSVVVGVLGLDVPILTAGFAGVRTRLTRIAVDASADAMQREFAARLESVIQRSGPQGWLTWALDYRHMFVHRGRHTHMFHVDVAVSRVLGARGERLLLRPPRPVPLLARDPNRSEIEVFRDTDRHHMLLTENGVHTIERTLEAVISVISDAGSGLQLVWRSRRAQPQRIIQPVGQWPALPASRPGQFTGFAPDSVPFEADRLLSNPLFLRRARAAALSTEDSIEWAGYPPSSGQPTTAPSIGNVRRRGMGQRRGARTPSRKRRSPRPKPQGPSKKR